MRLMIDFELVIEVRDMEESFVDVVINLKEQVERDEKEVGENRVEKRLRVYIFCKLLVLYVSCFFMI